MRILFFVLSLFISVPTHAQVKIAVLGAFTGPIQEYSQIKDYIDIWKKENPTILNQQYEIRYFDDGCDGKKTAESLEYVIRWNPHVLIGPTCSGAMMTNINSFSRLKIPVITPSATADILSEREMPNFFRTINKNSILLNFYVEFMKDKGKKIASVNDGSVFGKGQTDYIEKKLGDKIFHRDTYYINNNNKNLYEKLKTLNIDLIFYGGYNTELFNIVNELRNTSIKIIYTNSPDFTPEFVKKIGNKMKDIYLFGEIFKRNLEIKNKFNGKSYQLGVNTYVALEIFKQSAENVNSLDYEKIIKHMKSNKFDVVFGKIQFSETGDMISEDFEYQDLAK